MYENRSRQTCKSDQTNLIGLIDAIKKQENMEGGGRVMKAVRGSKVGRREEKMVEEREECERNRG